MLNYRSDMFFWVNLKVCIQFLKSQPVLAGHQGSRKLLGLLHVYYIIKLYKYIYICMYAYWSTLNRLTKVPKISTNGSRDGFIRLRSWRSKPRRNGSAPIDCSRASYSWKATWAEWRSWRTSRVLRSVKRGFIQTQPDNMYTTCIPWYTIYIYIYTYII